MDWYRSLPPRARQSLSLAHLHNLSKSLAAFSNRERAPVQVDVEREAAFLVALAEHGIPSDVQELLVRGDGRGTVAPGALRKALAALTTSLQTGGEGEERDVEAAAWAWLEKRFGTASEDPVDRAYAADEMVDAFIAGRARHSLSPAPSALSVPEKEQ